MKDFGFFELQPGRPRKIGNSQNNMELVKEFLEAFLHSIAYSRGLYPTHDTICVNTLNVTYRRINIEPVIEYFKRIIHSSLDGWLKNGKRMGLSLIITSHPGNSNKVVNPLEQVMFEFKVNIDSFNDDVRESLSVELGSALLKLQTYHAGLPDLPRKKAFRILLYTDSFHNNYKQDEKQWKVDCLPREIVPYQLNEKIIHSYEWPPTPTNLLNSNRSKRDRFVSPFNFSIYSQHKASHQVDRPIVPS